MTGLIVDVIGFLTGAILYAMLVVMAWREHARNHAPGLASRAVLPLAMGGCGLMWNIGALLAFVPRAVGGIVPPSALVAMAFSALGYLPAVVVHSLLEGRETALRHRLIRPAIVAAYTLSTLTALMHVGSAARGLPVPSGPALWISTVGFGGLTAALLVATRHQPIGRRGVWVAGLSIFAVSALHFVGHSTTESWSVELLGHHASLPLALTILHQDYRFAFADIFLKNAIALLMLMAVSLGIFSAGVIPLLQWQEGQQGPDPRALSAIVVLWMATTLLYPPTRRLADRFVDRVVLRRPDFIDALGGLIRDLAHAATEERALGVAGEAASRALGGVSASIALDRAADASPRLVTLGPDRPSTGPRGLASIVLRVPTVDAPHPSIVFGPLGAGRRLLSDDERLLDGIARTAAQRIDSLRLEQERSQRDIREQEIRRLATEAELRALRAQLQPHFLFNALTTIGYLIQHAPTRALDTLMRLTSVLRGVLRQSTVEFCTIEEEIDLIRAYLDIEQARFEERLGVTIDVQPVAREMMVPTLLLQPLVENAVKHGLARKRAGGVVAIRATVDDGRLLVVVSDDGVGFTPPAAGPGLGLRSVAERLRVHYGERAVVDIQSTTGSGTRISLSLPALRGAPAAQERAI